MEHFSCSKPAVLCVSRRLPVVSGPEAKVEVLRARVGTTGGDRFVRVTLNRYLVRFLWLQTIDRLAFTAVPYMH